MKKVTLKILSFAFLICVSMLMIQCSDDPMTDHGESFLTADFNFGDSITTSFEATSVVLEEKDGALEVTAMDAVGDELYFIIKDFDGIVSYVAGGVNDRTEARITLSDPVVGTWTSKDSKKRIIKLSVFQYNNAFISGEFSFGAGPEENEVIVTNGQYKFVR